MFGPLAARARAGDVADIQAAEKHFVRKAVARQRRRFGYPVAARATVPDAMPINQNDLELLQRAATVSCNSAGLTHPHPNHGCVLTSASGQVITEAFLRAQGATSAEQLACSTAGAAAQGGTAYVNLETGDCHGDTIALESLLRAGVGRVVVGLRNPLPHMRGAGVELLQASGVDVVVLEDDPLSLQPGTPQHTALLACLRANEPLLHRAALRKPMSILKYAMTLDGKIATHTGHSAWVSNTSSRARVFEMRAASDVVIVGGQTVRRDNPRLTTRRDHGHQPARIVMSRTLDLPGDANLWDTTNAPTIVMTQQGAREDFQRLLRSKGVEVVQFDFLTPSNVADYCFERGFMQCFWECGGTLAAPAIASGTIHKVMSFVAPKIIGGTQAPTPVGNLGFVEMTQAVQLVDVEYEAVAGDLLITGALPSSGGLLHLHKLHATRRERAQAPKQLVRSVLLPDRPANGAARPGDADAGVSGRAAAAPENGAAGVGGAAVPLPRAAAAAAAAAPPPATAEFYKAWDQWGCLSNFSPHAIDMPYGRAPLAAAAAADGRPFCRWPSVEHYYQAQKFWRAEAAPGEPSTSDDAAARVVDQILAAESPEEAARIGRFHQHRHPELMRDDWDAAKVGVMLEALRRKFSSHAGPQCMLLSTLGGGSRGYEGGGGFAVGPLELVEASPHDYFWGRGRDGTGKNMLGQLLMQVRDELVRGIADPDAHSRVSLGPKSGRLETSV